MAYVVVNIEDYVWLRLRHRNELELVTDQIHLKEGWMATLWGAGIYVNRKVPEGSALMISENEIAPYTPDWEPDLSRLVKIPKPIPRELGRTAWERLIEDEQ